MKPTAKQFLTLGVTLVVSALLMQNCKKTEIDPLAEQMTAEEELAAAQKKKEEGIDLKLFASGFTSPLGVVAFPDETKRLAVIDQTGQVWILDRFGNKLSTPFIDASSKMVTLRTGFDERGLLGLAFHPNYKQNGKFYLYYNAPPAAGGAAPGVPWDNLATISEFKVSSNPNLADIGSERFLLRLNDPQFNHNGGTLAFGKDDYLYIAIGDGGRANDTGPGHVQDWYPVNDGGNAQNIEANFFGKILRIDVNGGNPYRIPQDNPFVGKTGLDEIYAYGLRNPYRFSFDMEGSRDLIAGDAGQLMFEEIDVIRKGGNYGWNVKEGNSCFNAATSTQPFGDCPDRDIWNNKLTGPVIELINVNNPNGGGIATTVIGGNVYRGETIKDLKARYIFGTFSRSSGVPNAELFSAKTSGNNNWSFSELRLKSFPDHLGQYLKGFGQDLKGEIYVTTSSIPGPTQNTGKVYKIVPVDD